MVQTQDNKIILYNMDKKTKAKKTLKATKEKLGQLKELKVDFEIQEEFYNSQLLQNKSQYKDSLDGIKEKIKQNKQQIQLHKDYIKFLKGLTK